MSSQSLQLAFKSISTDQFRNFCILAHVDHGKTTLTDLLISMNGIISQKTAGTLRYLDCRPDEQEREITLKTSSISLLYRRSEESTNPLHLINVLDSPGHVDFSSEVSAAVRLADGAIIVVDAVEGVCVQTHAVLQQAYREGLQCFLLINKMDRLILELKLSPEETVRTMERIVEECNSIVASLLRESMFTQDQPPSNQSQLNETQQKEGNETTSSFSTWEIDEEIEEQLYFMPSKGNVVFCSAIDSWAFTIPQMAKFYSDLLTNGVVPTDTFSKAMWGQHYLRISSAGSGSKQNSQNASSSVRRTIVNASHATSNETNSGRTIFAVWCLQPLWDIYTAVNERN
ncbi:MAG: putative Elongation factor 2 [Streblomastix strix]|uniref:Putative Elongation factor 2 n=1 Tax=Streblomastix strix TaxID=222440 RepID=A0A5J4VJV6_9EUKA|nr:MAG: putative Elongation factor 2 [Streblomastix strix]